eukprot:IDg9504t1
MLQAAQAAQAGLFTLLLPKESYPVLKIEDRALLTCRLPRRASTSVDIVPFDVFAPATLSSCMYTKILDFCIRPFDLPPDSTQTI